LPPDPIPSTMDIWMACTWVAPTRGLVKTVPAATLYKLDINVVDWTVDPVVVGDLVYTVPTYAAGKAFWSGIYLAPEAWGIVPFNPRIGAKVYAIDWWAPVGKLAPGMHGVTLCQKNTRTITDLSLMEQGQRKPRKTPKGEMEPVQSGSVVAAIVGPQLGARVAEASGGDYTVAFTVAAAISAAGLLAAAGYLVRGRRRAVVDSGPS
jgi:hypothetical protein